jgi:hypothetical protein
MVEGKFSSDTAKKRQYLNRFRERKKTISSSLTSTTTTSVIGLLVTVTMASILTSCRTLFVNANTRNHAAAFTTLRSFVVQTHNHHNNEVSNPLLLQSPLNNPKRCCYNNGFYQQCQRLKSTTTSSTNDDVSTMPPPSIEEIRKKEADMLSEWYSTEAYTLPKPPGDEELKHLRKGQRVVAFGDVHGDLNALRKFLVTAKIMDENSTMENPIWSGGDTICVQCGDILDRGDFELACIRALASLSRQAAEADGSLVMLYGNHEALNTVGLFHYANPGGNVEFEMDIGSKLDDSLQTNRWRLQFAGNQPSRWAAFEPGGILAHSLMANMKVAVVVGHTVFVHAGLKAEHLKTYGGIEGMNKEANDWITNSHHGQNRNGGDFTTTEEVINYANRRARLATSNQPPCLGGGTGDSPVWMRDYSKPNDRHPTNPKAQAMIDECLEELGGEVQRMVMGHTPQMQINAALKGKAWRVDVGASSGVMGGTPEVLEIIHGGDNEDDIISILRWNKDDKIPSQNRQVYENILF